MATSTVTPEVSSAPASAPDTSTAVTSSPEVSTPSTPVTTQTPDTPVQSAASAGKQENESDLEFLARKRTEREAKETPATEVKVEPKKPEVEADKFEKTAEAAQDKPEEVKVEEPKAEEDSIIPEEEADLQELGVMSPKDLNALAQKDPNLAKAFQENPELKNKLMASLRKAGEAAQFVDLFPDKESAEFARNESIVFTGFRDKFTTQQSVQDTGALLEEIARLTVQVDEQGNPVLDAQGNAVQDGSFFRFLDNVRQMDIANYRKIAEQNNDEELVAALDVFRERTSQTSPAKTDIPPELKAERQRLEQEKAEFQKTKTAEIQEKQKASDARVNEQIDGHFDRRFKEIAGRYAIADVAGEWLRDKLWEAVATTISQNPQFIAHRDDLKRLPVSQAAEERRVGLVQKHIDKVFWNLAKPLLQKAGAQAKAQADQKKTTLNTMKEESRSNVKGVGASPVPVRPKTMVETFTELKKNNPDREDAQLMAEARKLMAG